jgi:hypothetical protein
MNRIEVKNHWPRRVRQREHKHSLSFILRNRFSIELSKRLILYSQSFSGKKIDDCFVQYR